MAISSVFISLIMSMNYTKDLAAQFKFLIMLSTLTVLIPYLFSTAAYLIIRFQYSFKSAFQKAMAIALALSAFLFSMWIVVGSGQEVVYWGFLLSMSSVPIYAWVVRKRKLTDVTAN
jgi:APA family basic amino acid/polyamine antiporter